MKFQRIHILGAPGSGVTTLGRALAARHGYSFFDSDDYYWYTIDPMPYRRKRNPEHRLRLLRQALDQSADAFVLAGALLGWGNSLLDRFDAVVFRSLPTALRLERIRERETARYGAVRLAAGGDLSSVLTTFLAWAAAYDTAENNFRSYAAETAWLGKCGLPVLHLAEDWPLEDLLTEVEQFGRG